ncbi:MAG: glycoside hydrolase family 13 protein [Candidatus Methylacidiphilales bacterium]|nr:glycoside hydrolase family 13 protein [Candidatus Methylacidiphilales bacterium]
MKSPLWPTLLCLTLFTSPLRAEETFAEVPAWARDAIWYQIFPERFRDGDPANNPTRDSLVWPIRPGRDWAIMRWTADWYERAAWEKAMDKPGDTQPAQTFYKNGMLDRRYGGDLQGVINKLDYLAELGVNALYFNPVFYARSLHKYDGNSYHHIDPYFGPDPKGDLALMDQETADPATWHWTQADQLFLKLLKEAHARGIRVVIDGVFNHSGRDFFAFQNLRQKQEASPYKDWYEVLAFDDPATARNEFFYRGWWGHKSLPVYAETPDGRDMHPDPKSYIFQATRRWMDPDGDGNAKDGIDGWRLDVADELPPKFWADWHEHVRRINPAAYTSAEVWSNPLELIHRGGFTAAMNYHGCAIPVKGHLIDNHIPPSRFAAMIDERRKALPPAIAAAMQNLIDSHDTDRVASMCVNGELIKYQDPNHIDFNTNNNAGSSSHQLQKPNERQRAIQRLVALFQVTFVGAPMFYYGTEAGMWGGGDPDCRMPMVWEDLKFDPQTRDPRGNPRKPDDANFERDLFRFYKEAIALRRNTSVLREGDFSVLGAFDKENCLVFLRQSKNAAAVVAWNRSDATQTIKVEIPESARPLLQKTGLLFSSRNTEKATSFEFANGKMTLILPPLTGVVVGNK